MESDAHMESSAEMAVIKTDIGYIKASQKETADNIKEIYLELKTMRERYPTRMEFNEKVIYLEKELLKLASKEEVNDLWRDVNWNKKIIWATIFAIIGLAYKVFEKYILHL